MFREITSSQFPDVSVRDRKKGIGKFGELISSDNIS
jgi:hypothetical protein